MTEITTLVELLTHRAQEQPAKIGYTFLVDGETQEVHLSYGELFYRARAIAAELLCLNTPGERAVLLCPPSLDYITAFFGCLCAGIIAVPAYPPRPNRSLSRLKAIFKDSQATIVLLTESVLASLANRLTEVPELHKLRWLTIDQIDDELYEKRVEPQNINSKSLAFLQYTSGSTGTPKGVMVSHSNVLHNSDIIHRCFEHTSNSKVVTWLPPYHDMGLIGGILQPIYGNFPMILMSPMAFLQKPRRWLEAISRFQATTSGGPNFAYDLCVSKISQEYRGNLDLSNWNLAFTGAEPVRAETLERFSHTFAECGFRAKAFYPCYGMAEATLFISGGFKKADPVVCTVQAADLEKHQVIETSEEKIGSRKLVGCGRTWFDYKLIIVNPESLIRSQENEVGEIWVSGSSIALGYWKQLEQTQETFAAFVADTGDGPFLRTGDLGFVKNGELFVTGRIKDLVIIDGCNHYPQDIELTILESHSSLRTAAAFSIDNACEDRLVIVAELERSAWNSAEAVIKSIRTVISENHDLQVHAIQLLKPGGIPKTSSGKIQRLACRNSFLAGHLEVIEQWSHIRRNVNTLNPNTPERN